MKQIYAALLLATLAVSACTSVPGALSRPDAIPQAADQGLG